MFIIGWINTVILGLLGITLLITRRWSHLRWLLVYALVASFLSLIQLFGFHVHEISVPKRIICWLLLLGAVSEVLHKEANKRPHWLWFALFGLTVVPFLPLNPVLLYYIPQHICNIGFAMELNTALRVKSAPLLACAVFGAATFVSDVIKFFKPIDEVIKLLVFLDPLFFTAMVLTMFTGFFKPEIEKLVLPSLKAIKDLIKKTYHNRFGKYDKW